MRSSTSRSRIRDYTVQRPDVVYLNKHGLGDNISFTLTPTQYLAMPSVLVREQGAFFDVAPSGCNVTLRRKH